MNKPIIHREFEQQTDTWLDFKLGKFGSTDAQAVSASGAGLNSAVYKKVAERLSGMREESYINDQMLRGIEYEPLARASFEIKTGKSVETVGCIELDEYTVCSPDGLVGKNELLEIKCPTASNYVKALHTQSVPSDYMWQIQFQLYVSDRSHCFYTVFNENFEDLVIIRVKRDENKIEKIKLGITSGVNDIKNILRDIRKNGK